MRAIGIQQAHIAEWRDTFASFRNLSVRFRE
jgi:hypothetical protein